MIVLGVVLTVVGFIVGVGGGLVLSDPAAMYNDKGQIRKDKEAKIAALISLCAALIIIGTLLFVRNFR
ncbi:MAG: hypothetical protein ACK4ND_07855 [Cytophagaceae bacterium]